MSGIRERGVTRIADRVNDAFVVKTYEVDGRLWAEAKMETTPYSWDEAKTFPKVIRIDGKWLVWSCWNSDHGYIAYREASENERIVRGKVRKVKR